jgi:hypothetical protein
MIYQILGVFLQVAGFVILCRVGGNLSDRLSTFSKWAPLAVACPLIIAMAVVALVFHPAITFPVQTAGLWLIAFAGGLVARAKQREEERHN